jgi:hypothetical protein
MRFAFAVFLVAAFGAGCVSSNAPIRHPSLPVLHIESPTSGTATSSASVTIVGQTDVSDIVVDGLHESVTDGRFGSRVDLHAGMNTFTLIAGNGESTTTQTLRIERVVSP